MNDDERLKANEVRRKQQRQRRTITQQNKNNTTKKTTKPSTTTATHLLLFSIERRTRMCAYNPTRSQSLSSFWFISRLCVLCYLLALLFYFREGVETEKRKRRIVVGQLGWCSHDLPLFCLPLNPLARKRVMHGMRINTNNTLIVSQSVSQSVGRPVSQSISHLHVLHRTVLAHAFASSLRPLLHPAHVPLL